MNFPPLDCHAHISVGVTNPQVKALGDAIIFGMTRNPSEAGDATKRYDPNILWGCGAHPAFVAGGGEVSMEQLERRAKRFAVIGEIGLDRRSGNLPRQEQVFEQLLETMSGEPVLLSVHSAGCSREVIAILRHTENLGVLMHWFTGTPEDVVQLLDFGCYFSVNAAMPRSLLQCIPLDRVLPETDFPVARKRTGSKPGDTDSIERTLAEIHGLRQGHIRGQFYRNLRRVSVETGAIDRMPSHLVDRLMLA